MTPTKEIVAWLRERSEYHKQQTHVKLFRSGENRKAKHLAIAAQYTAAANALEAADGLAGQNVQMRDAHQKLIERIGEVLDCTFDGSISEFEHDSDCIGCQLCKISNAALAIPLAQAAAQVAEWREKAGLLDWLCKDMERAYALYLAWTREPEDGSKFVDHVRAAKEQG